MPVRVESNRNWNHVATVAVFDRVASASAVAASSSMALQSLGETWHLSCIRDTSQTQTVAVSRIVVRLVIIHTNRCKHCLVRRNQGCSWRQTRQPCRDNLAFLYVLVIDVVTVKWRCEKVCLDEMSEQLQHQRVLTPLLFAQQLAQQGRLP